MKGFNCVEDNFVPFNIVIDWDEDKPVALTRNRTTEHGAAIGRRLATTAEALSESPDSPQLQPNAPNPFNTQTVISYGLPKPS